LQQIVGRVQGGVADFAEHLGQFEQAFVAGEFFIADACLSGYGAP